MSGFFVPHDLKAPLKGAVSGPLAGLTAAVKDLYAIAGEKAGAGKILKDTASFLKEQGKVSDVLANYGAFVTADALAGVSN